MDLMVGSTLQGGKYRLLEVLHQSEWGTTYRATHTYLERSVLLQTLSQAAQQQDDLAQLRQRFKAGARSMINQKFDHPQVLDCFEEDQLPFIVLEDRAEFNLSQLTDWLLSSAEAATESHPSMVGQDELRPIEVQRMAETIAETSITETSIPDIAETNGVEAAQTIQPGAIGGADPLPPAQSSAAVASRGIPSSAFQAHYLSRGAKSREPESTTQTRYVFQKPPKLKARFPVTLMVMALLGGSVGAGMGVALRLSSASPLGDDGTYRPRFSLFNREQSFPSQGTWPIQEMPTYAPVPSIEEPVYRTAPSFDTPDGAIEYLPPLAPDPLAEEPALSDPETPAVEPPLSGEEWNTQEGGLPPDKANLKEPVEPAPLPVTPDSYSDPASIDEPPPVYEAPSSPDSIELPLEPSPVPILPNESSAPDPSKLLPNTSVNVVSQ